MFKDILNFLLKIQAKINELSTQSKRLHGNKLFIYRSNSSENQEDFEEEDKIEDFFHQEFPLSVDKSKSIFHEMSEGALFSNEGSPTASLLNSSTIKASLGGLKSPAKKPIFNAKKIGMGAQKFKMDFSEAEKRANDLDKERENFEKLSIRSGEKTEKNNENGALINSLSSKFLVKAANNEKRVQEKIKEVANDPNKAKMVDRLGMCGMGRAGVTHSLASGMKTIQQEGVSASRGVSSTLKSPKDDFSDVWEVIREEE